MPTRARVRYLNQLSNKQISKAINKMIDSEVSSLSVSASESESSQDKGSCSDMVLSNPMYYVLGQFLETADGKNIATILNELVTVLNELKATR
jgi:hypothetical protein